MPTPDSYFRRTWLLCAVAAAFPALADQDVWEYPVHNADDNYGLYTNEVYYAPQCSDPASKSCKPRDHFFSFREGALLTIDFTNNIAELRGRVHANKPDNSMEWDLVINFGLIGNCNGDSLVWPSKWGKVIPGLTPDPEQQDPLRQQWYCLHAMSGYLTDLIQGQQVDVQLVSETMPLQLGIGANGVDRNVLGGWVEFAKTVGDPDKTWQLAMNLEPRTFQIVFCPADGTDTGDGTSGTQDRADCTIDWFGDGVWDDTTQTWSTPPSFASTITDEPDVRGNGTIDGVLEIPDPRGYCAGDGSTGSQSLFITRPSGVVEIPGYLCGIPDSNGQPIIKLIDANVDFWSDPSFSGILSSVVEHEVADPQNTEYGCGKAPLRQPVVAWQPRNDEIPILEPSGTGDWPWTRRSVVRDVTNGCGSYRGGSSQLSFLVSNLVYAPWVESQDFHYTVIAPEIQMLEDTMVLSTACVNAEQSILSILYPDLVGEAGQSRFMDHLRATYDAGNYTQVIDKLNWLLAELMPGGRLVDAYAQCYADRSTGRVTTTPDDYDPPALPRNFRGDLEAQTRHIIYNIESKAPGYK